MEIVNMKICTYYFFNDIINIKHFDLNRIKIDKKSSKMSLFVTLGILLLKTLPTQKINSVIPFYFIIDETDRYIEESNGNKYLRLAFTDKNKDILKKYIELWNEIKDLIR